MTKIGWFSRLTNQRSSRATIRQIAGGVGATVLLMMAGSAVAQAPAADRAPAEPMSAPFGYSLHQSVDMGGRMVNTVGSPAMYSTLVNAQSGPRVLGESFELRAMPGKKGGLVDNVTAFGSGFGGDPNIFARLNASKGKLYDFSGLFRRDRQYFDYDLLGNPNITTGQSTPIGPSKAPTGSLAWPQLMQSPVTFNTVRRMTDTNLTILPLSTFSFRAGYSHNTFEGPTLSPSYTIMKYDALLQQYQRNGTDDFLGAIDWKPQPQTRIAFEERVTHYKADSFFTLNPKGFMVQEADGTPVYLGNWDSQAAYGIAACNTSSMGSAYTNSTTYTLLSPANSAGGLPVINAACAAVTSYTRTQPTRILTPTETLRLQTSALKNVTMNGLVSYTMGSLNMPSYYEDVKGLSGAVREITYSGGHAKGHRDVFSVDYGIVWQAAKTFDLADQVDYVNIQEPGRSIIPAPGQLSTPAAPNQTINYGGTLTPGTAALPHGINGTLTYNFYGQKALTNLLTASWDATARARFSLTYRYKQQRILQGVPHNIPIPFGVENDPINGYVDINENGGILNAALRPTANWDVNGTVEIAYADNAFTSVSPRQTKRYRVHTKYRPKNWAILSGAFSDLERHNNTFNNEENVSSGDVLYQGPLNHVDHSRAFGMGATLSPNEHYGLDLNYAYTDVYTATNICYTSAASATQAGAATLKPDGTPAVCPGVFARGSTTVLVDWFGRDFMDAPTQFGSAAIMLTPSPKVHADLGYTVSSVAGSQFFTDARAVNGSLTSTYQSPFVKLAWTERPGLIWKAQYNFFGYGEGGVSGAQYCSLSTSATASVVPCASLSLPTGRNESPSGLTAPRNFHANNVTLGVHYEF
jgi:hypothetical protein